MPNGHLPTVSTDRLRHLLADPAVQAWLVHVTDRTSFGDGHIPGSLSRPDTVTLIALGRGAVLLLYGEHDRAVRAPALVRELRAAGLAAYWYAGGLAAWKLAGHPTERSGL